MPFQLLRVPYTKSFLTEVPRPLWPPSKNTETQSPEKTESQQQLKKLTCTGARVSWLYPTQLLCMLCIKLTETTHTVNVKLDLPKITAMLDSIKITNQACIMKFRA